MLEKTPDYIVFNTSIRKHMLNGAVIHQTQSLKVLLPQIFAKIGIIPSLLTLAFGCDLVVLVTSSINARNFAGYAHLSSTALNGLGRKN